MTLVDGWKEEGAGRWRALARGVRLGCLVAAVSLALTASWALGSSGSSSSVGRVWSKPVQVDRFTPGFDTTGLFDVQCPSATLCVAVDSTGNFRTSTNPTGGPGSWRVTFPFSDVRGLSGAPTEQVLSCPSVDLCVAGALNDELLVSTHPTGGASAWNSFHIPGSQQIQAVSCPNSNFCLAIDSGGNVLSSSDPTGGPEAWQEKPTFQAQPAGTVPTSLSCPAANFCAAVGDGGKVFTSTDPTGGSASWQSRVVDTGSCIPHGCSLHGISCPSIEECVAYDGQNVVSSAAPTTASWKTVQVGSGETYGTWISCPSSALCLALDGSGVTFVSSDPTGAAAAWKRTEVGDQGLSAVACPSSKLCVGSTFRGQMLTTSDPARGQWIVQVSDAFNQIQGIACPGADFCVAVDDGGNVLRSSNPGGGPASWRAASVDPGSYSTPGLSESGLTGISCPTVHLCVAWDAHGRVFSSGDPAEGHKGWRQERLPRRAGVGPVDCPMARLCVGVGSKGRLWFTRRPLAHARPWKSFTIYRGIGHGNDPSLQGVDCFRTRLCVVGSFFGDVLASRRPIRGPRSWKGVTGEDYGGGSYGRTGSNWSISCPGSSLCVLDDGSGNLFWSTRPSTANSWKIAGDTTYGGPYGERVACASAHLCFSFVGAFYVSTNPAGGANTWRAPNPGPDGAIDAIACVPGAAECFAAGRLGDIVSSR